MSKRSIIVWSEPESYLQLPSSTIIVSQVVDYNLVFNQNSSYLVQMQLCYRWYTPKNRLIPIIGRGVGSNMVVTHTFCSCRILGDSGRIYISCIFKSDYCQDRQFLIVQFRNDP